MRDSFTSGLLAGVTAAVIWMAISFWVGMSATTVGAWALGFLVVVTIVSTIISEVVGRSRAAQTP